MVLLARNETKLAADVVTEVAAGKVGTNNERILVAGIEPVTTDRTLGQLGQVEVELDAGSRTGDRSC